MNSIIISHLHKEYKNNIIINDLTINLCNSHIYILNGPNGAGKTTFFKCLMDECDFIGTINKNKLKFQLLPDKVILPLNISTINFLKLFSKNLNLIKSYLELFSISEYSNKRIQTLSKGTKQKVIIIKTLLVNSDVYLFDEALDGLDLYSRNIFRDEINHLHHKGKIIILSTHYINEFNNQEVKLINL